MTTWYKDSPFPILDVYMTVPISFKVKFRTQSNPGVWRESNIRNVILRGYGLGATNTVAEAVPSSGGINNFVDISLYKDFQEQIGQLINETLVDASQSPINPDFHKVEISYAKSTNSTTAPSNVWTARMRFFEIVELYVYQRYDTTGINADREDMYSFTQLGFDTRRIGGIGNTTYPNGFPAMVFLDQGVDISGRNMMTFETMYPLLGIWNPKTLGWNIESDRSLNVNQTISPFDSRYRTTRVWGVNDKMVLSCDWVHAAEIFTERRAGFLVDAYTNAIGVAPQRFFGGTLQSVFLSMGLAARAEDVRRDADVLAGFRPPIKGIFKLPYLSEDANLISIQLPRVTTIETQPDDVQFANVADDGYRLLTYSDSLSMEDLLSVVQGRDQRYNVNIGFTDVTPPRPGRRDPDLTPSSTLQYPRIGKFGPKY